MRHIRHFLAGIVLPAVLLVGLTWWRAASAPHMVIFSGAWWVWYATIVGTSILVGVGLNRFWAKRDCEERVRSRWR